MNAWVLTPPATFSTTVHPTQIFKMPLVIVDATEDDFPEMMRIDNEAYKTSVFGNLLFPQGRSLELLELQGLGMLKQAQEDPTVRNIKVIDTDHNDEPIAFARWHFYFGDNAQYIQADPDRRAAIPGADPAVLAFWTETVRRKRIEHIGRTSHCCESANLSRDD